MSIKPKLTAFDTTMITVSLVIGIFRVPAFMLNWTGPLLVNGAGAAAGTP